MRTDKDKMNPGSPTGFNSVPDVSEYEIPSSDNVSDKVTNEGLNISVASLESMSIGSIGKMSLNEIQVKTNNFFEGTFLEGSTGININPQKCFGGFILMACLVFALILVSMSLKNDDATEEQKQCLPGYYSFPQCLSK